MRQTKQGISRWRYWTGLVLLVVLFSIVIGFSLGRLQVYVVASDSMAPTIIPGDHLLVHARKNMLPERGQVVALRDPSDPSDYLCKRLVGLPGDLVEIRRGYLYLNGERWDTQGDLKFEPMPVRRKRPVRLGPDEYYVLGDNRRDSFDSSAEDFGTIRRADFIGKVVLIYWPLGRFAALNPQTASAHPRLRK